MEKWPDDSMNGTACPCAVLSFAVLSFEMAAPFSIFYYTKNNPHPKQLLTPFCPFVTLVVV
jgi:hypothetical protein